MKRSLELRSDIVLNLGRADLVLINNELLRPDYLLVPDDMADKDDVLLECTLKDGKELDLTLAELSDAQYLGEGAYLLPQHGVVTFLQEAAIH